MRRLRFFHLSVLVLFLAACGGDDTSNPVPIDAATDAPKDGASDAQNDAAHDASADAPLDAPAE
jgi:hypothetical protein